MPEMDGLDATRELIRRADGGPRPMIVAMTANAMQGDREECLAAGMDDYLSKPIRDEELAAALEKVPSGGRAQPTEAGLAVRHPLSILVAEDDETNQRLALLLLETMGYDAEVVSDGEKAVQRALEHSYDVILMDVQMPEMDGLDATRELIRRSGSGPRPRIVAMTANAMPSDREECLAAGMDDYLSKPIRVDELAAALERVPVGGSEPVPATAAVPAPDADAAPDGSLDVAAIERLRGLVPAGQPDVLKKIVDTSLRAHGKPSMRWRRRLESGDDVGLTRTAHTLKSGAASFGAMALEDGARTLEESGRAGTLEHAADMISEIRVAFEAAAPAIEALKDD